MNIARLLELTEQKLDYVSKEKTTFIVDKKFLVAWIEEEGNPTEVAYVAAYMDLLQRVKEKGYSLPQMIIPVDVLIEMEADGKKYVLEKVFIDAINTFFRVKQVDPDKQFKNSTEAVYELAKLLKSSKDIVILTVDKQPYVAIEKIYPLTSQDLFFTILLVYNCFSEGFTDDLREIYETWLGDISNGNE